MSAVTPIPPDNMRSAGSVCRAVVEAAKLRNEETAMKTEFTLEELKALRRIADTSRATPSAPAFWTSIYDKCGALIADAVCKEPELSLPTPTRGEDQDAA